MKKFLSSFLLVMGIGVVGLLAVRFFLGGNEDAWICENNEWVKHGKPSDPRPTTGCGVEEKWREQIFNQGGITLNFRIPPDFAYREEIAEDGDRIRVASFYVEKGSKDNPDYQLYVVYQPNEVVTEKDLERVKTGMSPNSASKVMIDGYKGIEEQIEISGAKNHYLTAVLKGDKLLTFSTYPITEENRTLTEQILQTIRFD